MYTLFDEILKWIVTSNTTYTKSTQLSFSPNITIGVTDSDYLKGIQGIQITNDVKIYKLENNSVQKIR